MAKEHKDLSCIVHLFLELFLFTLLVFIFLSRKEKWLQHKPCGIQKSKAHCKCVMCIVFFFLAVKEEKKKTWKSWIWKLQNMFCFLARWAREVSVSFGARVRNGRDVVRGRVCNGCDVARARVLNGRDVARGELGK